MTMDPTGARRLSRTACLLLLTVVAAFTAAQPASAAATVDSSQAAGGLHVPQGALVDPNGRLWVADHQAGFCRVSEATWRGAGTLQHPRDAGDSSPRTCLGGLLPFAKPGPLAAINPVLVDPTPAAKGSGDEIAFIADTSTHSADVFRARWNPDTGLFDDLDVVKMDADPVWPTRPRPTGISVGPDGNVYVVFARSRTIQRIVRATTDQPVVETVGRIQGRRAAGVAAGFDASGELTLYIAEATALTQVHPDPIAQPLVTAGPDIGQFYDLLDQAFGPNAVDALHYDLETDALYAGTANGGLPTDAGTETIMRFDIFKGTVDREYASGFSPVAGLSAGPGGTLLVSHDSSPLFPAQPLGTGELRVIGRPVAHITAGPTAADGNAAKDRSATNSGDPAFTVAGDAGAELSCLVRARDAADPAPQDWTSCTGGALTATGLADGDYVAAVQATQGGVAGVVESHAFRVDRVRPDAPQITSPAAGAVVSRAPWFSFKTLEPGVRDWECRFEALVAAWEPCTIGRTKRFTTGGAHSVWVRGIDRAGNVGFESAEHTFTVDMTLPIGGAPRRLPTTPDFPGNRSQVGHDLHISAGGLVDPHGRTWVSDHHAGFCRITESDLGLGVIDHPKVATDLQATRTCLGGLLPFAGEGPAAAGQPAFLDPTPAAPNSGDELAFIPDLSSHSNVVYRAQWDPEDGLFRFKDTISVTARKPRPVAASIGPDGALYVVTKEDDTIERFAEPAAAAPVARIVGHTKSRLGAVGVAAGRSTPGGPVTVYVAEKDDLTKLTPRVETATTPAPTATTAYAIPPDQTGGPSQLGAAIYDLDRDLLYVGTMNGVTPADAGIDRVHRIAIATGALTPDYSTGHSIIGGFALREDGKLLVTDDPAVLDVAQPLGTGRLFLAGLPSAHVAEGPTNAAGAQAADRAFTNAAQPRFGTSGPGTRECVLLKAGDPAPADSAWAGCNDGFTPASALAEGTYLLAVRSVAGTVTGPVEVHEFTVDTTAPLVPEIARPLEGARVGASPWVELKANEPSSFECKLDGAPFKACATGRPFTFAADGDHTLVVRPIDRAGNVGPESPVRSFWADGTIPTVRFTAPARNLFTNQPSVDFAFEPSEQPSTMACSISGPGLARSWDCSSATYTATGLVEGEYVLKVRARDQHGNVGPVNQRSVVVDMTKPVVSIPSPAQDEPITVPAALVFTASEAVNARCMLDGGPWQLCETPVLLSDKLAPGVHTLILEVTDLAGNVTTVSRTFRVTAVDPGAAAGTGNPLRGGGQVVPGTTPVAPVASAVPVPPPVRVSGIFGVAQLIKLGIPVTVTTQPGQTLVQLRIVQGAPVAGAARAARITAAAAARRVIAAETKRVGKAGTHRLRLTGKRVRSLKPGRYVLEVRAGRDARSLTVVARKSFTVRR